MNRSIPKGYKQTDIGVIPEEWDIATIDEISSLIGDGIHSTPRFTDNGQYYFVNGNNLSSGVIKIYDDTKRTSLEEYQKYKRPLLESTILLSINGTIGSIGYYNNEPIVLGKSAAFINVKEKIVNKHFIYYCLQSESTISAFHDGLTGSTIKNLGLGAIRNTLLPLPKLEEQTAIANALSDVDALIHELKKLLVKKQAIKTATIEQLLTGKTRLPAFDNHKHSHGDAYKSEFKGTKSSEYGEIPEDWEVKAIGELCEYQNGKAQEQHFNFHDGYKVISIGNYSESGYYNETGIYVDKKLKPEVGRFVFQQGDLAMILNDKTIVGAIIGRSILIDADDTYIMNQRTMRLVSKGKVQPDYLHFFLNSDFCHKRIVSMAKPGTQIYINTDDVLNFCVLIPSSLEEQIAISAVLSDMEKEIQFLEQRLEKVRQVKQGIMQELLTGKTRLVYGTTAININESKEARRTSLEGSS